MEQNLLNCATEHGIYGTCHSKQHSFEGCSHIGGSEQTCRPFEQEKCYGNKMVSPQVSFIPNISDLGVSINKPIALSENCQIQIFFSWIPHQEALTLNALSISWEKCSGMHILQFV